MKVLKLKFVVGILLLIPMVANADTTIESGNIGGYTTQTITTTGGSNATQETSIAQPISQNTSVYGSSTTAVTGGYATGGSGQITPSNNVGSSSNTSYGVGVRTTFP